MLRTFLLYILLATLSINGVCSQLPDSCPLDITGREATQFGLLIRDVKTGEVVRSINADEVFVPASITKALTVASALSQLPADKRFTTDFYIDGEIEKEGILKGNIIVKCVGDPTFESKHFSNYKGVCDSIYRHLKVLGVNNIKGRIIFKYPVQLDQRVPKGWMNEDLIWPYGTAHHAFNYKDNRMTFFPSTLSTRPGTSNLPVTKVSGGKIYKLPDSDTLFVGTSAKGPLEIAQVRPEDNFATELRKYLSDNGISVENYKVKGNSTERLVYSHKSPAFSEIFKSLMFRSDNLMAEGMLRTLAPARSRESAIQREISLWDARGLNTERIFVEDGSGLSRKNRLSPRFMSDMLQWMLKSEDAKSYVSFFPRAGLEGTMKGMLKGTSLEGRVATKTGSMRGVQCFAGYILGENSKPTHTIVVMVNAFKCDRGALKSAIGKYLLSIFNKNNNNND